MFKINNRMIFFANEEYLATDSGGANDIKSDLNALINIFDKVIFCSIKRGESINLKSLIQESDYLYFSGFLSYERLNNQSNIKDFIRNIKIINSKDLHFFRELRRDMLDFNRKIHKGVMERELYVYSIADLVLFYTDEEINLATRLNSKINAKKSYYYNSNFKLNNKFAYNNNLIFIGNFEHYPNVDAIMHFDLNYHLPKDLFTFEIYGKNSNLLLQKLVNPKNNYVVIGEIVNSDQCYKRGGLFISPIRYGGGIKIKIVEAALSHVPIVATKESVEGLGLIPNYSYIELNENIQFQRMLIDFNNNLEYFRTIASNAYETINKLSNKSIVIDNFYKIFKNLRKK
jgi:hypothetical protein